MSPFQPVPDPFPAKGPIPPGSPHFYEREELFIRVQTLLRYGDSVSIVGERKAGKTSFINYLATHLPDTEFIPVLLDVQGVAPGQDAQFLTELILTSVGAIAEATDLPGDIAPETPEADVTRVYRAFKADLDRYRPHLPKRENGAKRKLVWLLDEIEMLRNYENTELFSFLRPIVQQDPDFRFVAAGHDILYTITRESEWSPFFNAFSSVRLEGLSPTAAQALITDPLQQLGVALIDEAIPLILSWTGRKPYYLKWLLSIAVEVLNQEQAESTIITADTVRAVQARFFGKPDLSQHFAFFWNQASQHQQAILQLMASQEESHDRKQIHDGLRDGELLEEGITLSDLVLNLTRLVELGFLYEQAGSYTFTSECLRDWIRTNRPLD
ncbi:MAG TPA: ATP-binding protein [Anaerolineae bacterium]|nr:ATP-binding protein [Anaerolineae bacterium]